MAESPDNTPAETYDRVVAYAAIYKGERAALDLDAQIAACHADAKEHDAIVVAEVKEEVRRRDVPLLKRTGLTQAIRRVRALRGHGVLVVTATSRIGPSLPVVIGLVEDAGAGLATVQPMCRDRLEHFRLIETVDSLRLFADQREKFRQESDVVALRRTATWPLTGPEKETE